MSRNFPPIANKTANKANNKIVISLTPFDIFFGEIFDHHLNKKPTKEALNKAYQKIQKKIHPDISPETSRLSAIVNEAKEIVLKDIS